MAENGGRRPPFGGYKNLQKCCIIFSKMLKNSGKW